MDSSKLSYSNFLSDKFDNVFCIKNNVRSAENRVLKLVDDHWVEFNPNQEGAYEIWLDRDYQLVATTQPFKQLKYFKLNGDIWNEITHPDSIKRIKVDNYSPVYIKRKSEFPAPPCNSGDYSFAKFLKYSAQKTLMICADANDHRKMAVFQWSNNQWEKYSDFFGGDSKLNGNPFGDHHENSVMVGKTLYSWNETGLWKNAGGGSSYTVTEKVRYLNGNIDFVGTEEDKKEIYKYPLLFVGTYKRNGKLGLRKDDGTVLTCPVFDKITFEKCPTAELEEGIQKYSFHLVGEGMDFYYRPYEWVGGADTTSFRGYSEKIVTRLAKCTRCEGKGEIITTTTEEIREWVPPTTTTTNGTTDYETHYNTSSGQYERVAKTRTTTTTVPGYYRQVDGKTVRKTEPCHWCYGMTESISYKWHNATYDKELNKYVEKIEVVK